MLASAWEGVLSKGILKLGQCYGCSCSVIQLKSTNVIVDHSSIVYKVIKRDWEYCSDIFFSLAYLLSPLYLSTWQQPHDNFFSIPVIAVSCMQWLNEIENIDQTCFSLAYLLPPLSLGTP